MARQREYLSNELSNVRRHALHAATRQDFRGIAKLTLEAARLNKAIADNEEKELLSL